MEPMAGSAGITTADELFEIIDDGGHRYELLHGQLHRMTPPGTLHAVVAARFVAHLSSYVVAKDLVLTEVGCLLDSKPDHLRAPDVAFIDKDRVPADGIPRKYWEGAPDFCVEVVSPRDTFLRSAKGLRVDPVRGQAGGRGGTGPATGGRASLRRGRADPGRRRCSGRRRRDPRLPTAEPAAVRIARPHTLSPAESRTRAGPDAIVGLLPLGYGSETNRTGRWHPRGSHRYLHPLTRVRGL